MSKESLRRMRVRVSTVMFFISGMLWCTPDLNHLNSYLFTTSKLVMVMSAVTALWSLSRSHEEPAAKEAVEHLEQTTRNIISLRHRTEAISNAFRTR